MNKQTVALWGCGRIGRVTGKLLLENGYILCWLYDRDPSKSSTLASDLGAGEVGDAGLEPDAHPQVDVIIDATGDPSLLPYWEAVLHLGKSSNVFLTRREPKAQEHVMMGVASVEPSISQGTTVAMGSCTGNALVPFISHLSREYLPSTFSCRVLHPLKQDDDYSLRSIETALSRSLADWEPDLAKKAMTQSMELPVDRGMALDLSICFNQPVSQKSMESWLKSLPSRCPHIQFSHTPPTSDSIVGNKASAVIDPGWNMVGNQLRLLLWQDNELGVSARILDLLETI
ncbi:hypothetical protein KKF84_22025 [Myxococcota bacterium]|nr:hypothetical protein [Myxococcota bacterium]MBU1538007.1 hypothetical protein [Myxococcota bacterium]